MMIKMMRSLPLLLPLVLVAIQPTTAEHECSGSGRIGDPLYYQDQTIPCSFLQQEDYAVLEYRFNFPVATDFERQVKTNAFVTAFHSTSSDADATDTSSSNGISLQMTSIVGFPEDLFDIYSFLRKGTCSDPEVWDVLNNGTWTPLNANNSAMIVPMAGDLPGEYARLYVGVALSKLTYDEEGMVLTEVMESCHQGEGEVSVAVALQDGEDDYRFSTDCLEIDRCFQKATPAPTWAPPNPPTGTIATVNATTVANGNNTSSSSSSWQSGFCSFDPTYASSNFHRGPKPGKFTYRPLEVMCPPVNESAIVWLDIKLPNKHHQAEDKNVDDNDDDDDQRTSARVSLAVSTGVHFNETDGIRFHGWDVHHTEEPFSKYCLLPDFRWQSKQEGHLDNGFCPPEFESKLCHDDRIVSESGSIHRIMGEVTNDGGCHGSLLFEATLVDQTVDEDVDFDVYEYASCASPLAYCEFGDSLPHLPIHTEAPILDQCMTSNGTKMFQPLTLPCPAQGELSTFVFDLWYKPKEVNGTIVSTTSNSGINVLTVVSDNAAIANDSTTNGLDVFLMYDTDSDPFPTGSCGNFPFFDGEPAMSFPCPPEPNKLCTPMMTSQTRVARRRYSRYYLGVLNEGGSCQDKMTIEVAIEDPEDSLECHSTLQTCSAPTPAPTWFQPPAPESNICAFDPSHNRYGSSYPNQGLSTYPSLVIPATCNATHGNTSKTLAWFDFRMPITGSSHHMSATQLQVAVTAMEDDKVEDLIVHVFTMPDHQQQNIMTNSCDQIEAVFEDEMESTRAEVNNWLCDGELGGPQTVCRSKNFNTYQGSVVRVFVSAYSNVTGHCAGDLKLDATLSDVSLANSEAPLELFQRSECIQGFTQCFPGDTFPEMTTWENPFPEDGITWDALDISEAPSATPTATTQNTATTSSPTMAPVVDTPEPEEVLTIPAVDDVQSVASNSSTLLTDASDELPEASDELPEVTDVVSVASPEEEISVNDVETSSSPSSWNAKVTSAILWCVGLVVSFI